MIYIVVIILLLILSIRYDINGETKYRSQWYWAMLVVFILIAGLRWRLGIDTPNYIHVFYKYTPNLDAYSLEDSGTLKNPLWVLINSIVRTMGGRFYVVQLIQAAFVNTLIFNYFKKHSKYIFTCVFFYAISGYTGICMEIMKAAFAIVICLYANDYFFEKKWIKGYALCILAFLFHGQALIMFIAPFLFFMRFNKMGILLIVLSYFLGFVIQQTMSEYLFLLDEDIQENPNFVKAAGYAENAGAKQNNAAVFMRYTGFAFSFFCVYLWKKFCKKDDNSNSFTFEPFLMISLCFSAMRNHIEIVYRLGMFFGYYFTMAYAEVFVKFASNRNRLTAAAAYARAFVIFLPFFFNVSLGYYLTWPRYHPYSSVIERSIDKNREKYYNKYDRYPPKKNEY